MNTLTLYLLNESQPAVPNKSQNSTKLREKLQRGIPDDFLFHDAFSVSIDEIFLQ